MSFILDALKKSENERQRADAPGLYEMKMAPPRRGVALWLIVLAGLLVINIIVLSVVLLRGGHGAAAPDANTAATTAPAAPPSLPAMTAPAPVAPPPAAVMQPQPAPPQSVPAQTAPAAGSAGNAPAAAGPAGGSEAADDAPAVEPPPRQAAPPAPSTRSAGGAPLSSVDVPSYQQLAGTPGSNLPDLKLDLHAYAENPAERFIFLNMTKLREGQRTPAGVQVESITPDGAILSWQGSRFFLQRQ